MHQEETLQRTGRKVRLSLRSPDLMQHKQEGEERNAVKGIKVTPNSFFKKFLNNLVVKK